MTDIERRADTQVQQRDVTEAQVLALVDNGRAELTRAVDAGDPAALADVVNRAAAIQYMSKKAKLAIDAVNAAARLKTDAEWHGGRMLRELERSKGGRPEETGNKVLPVSEYKAAIIAAEIDKMQAQRWQDMSRVDRADIDDYYKSTEAKRAEITSSAIAHKGARARRLETIAAKSDTYDETPPDDRPVPVIYADPPWRYDFAEADSRKIENQYLTMTVEDICALDPAPAEDAVLFLWTTTAKLREGLQVLEAWGFTYKTSMVWVKPQIGMGYYARGQHEFLLIGALGHLPTPLPEHRPSSVIDGRRTEHSAKPDLRPLLNDMYPGLWKREMFSRRPAEDLWLVHGNQTGGHDAG